MVRVVVIALLAGLVWCPSADAGPWLTKDVAYLRALDVLEAHQVAYLFDERPIMGWQLQHPDKCQRLSPSRVRCAFAVEREAPLETCGAWLTLIRRPWYIGWRISVHPGPHAHCDASATFAARPASPRRAILGAF